MDCKIINRGECAALQIVGRATRLPSNEPRLRSGRLGDPSLPIGFEGRCRADLPNHKILSILLIDSLRSPSGLPEAVFLRSTPILSKKMIVFRYFALFACLLSSVPLFAVDAPKVTFRGLATEGKIEGIYFTNSKGEPQEFVVNDYVKSVFYRASIGQPTEFYKLLPPEQDGAEIRREVVGQVDWPAGRGPFLVLVTRSGANFTFTATLDDESFFPMGSFRVLNLSTNPLVVRVENQEVRLMPQEGKVIKPPLPDEGKGVLFQVEKYSRPPLLLYSNIWSVTPETRALVFLLDKQNIHYPISVVRHDESSIQLQRQREREAQEEKEAKK